MAQVDEGTKTSSPSTAVAMLQLNAPPRARPGPVDIPRSASRGRTQVQRRRSESHGAPPGTRATPSPWSRLPRRVRPTTALSLRRSTPSAIPRRRASLLNARGRPLKVNAALGQLGDLTASLEQVTPQFRPGWSCVNRRVGSSHPAIWRP